MQNGFQRWANPSSPHKAGREARSAFEESRAGVKALLGWQGEVIFTSGASEALAIACLQGNAPLAAVSDVEHDAVLRHAKGAARLAVGANGLVEDIPECAGGIVAIQHVNNETGVIQPLGEIAAKVRERGGVLLADCAQSAGKIALPDADIIALSAHKFGGPIGVGALLVKDYKLLKPTGGQERGYRGGTENLPAVLALHAALLAGADWMAEAARLRAKLEKGLTAIGAEIVAVNAPRIATIGAYRMPGVSARSQLIRFDGEGIAISAGSACSSGSLKTSHVLEAMQYPHAGEVIRVSIGRETREAEIDAFLEAWAKIAAAKKAKESSA